MIIIIRVPFFVDTLLLPFSSHHRCFWGSLLELPSCNPFLRALPRPLRVFVGMEPFRRNIFPTKEPQNSTYHFYLKTYGCVKLQEPSTLLEAEILLVKSKYRMSWMSNIKKFWYIRMCY